jgi:hypothetical protein
MDRPVERRSEDITRKNLHHPLGLEDGFLVGGKES